MFFNNLKFFLRHCVMGFDNDDPPQTDPLGWGLISHFCSSQPDASLRCKFLGLGLVKRGNMSVVVAVQSCSSFFELGWVHLERVCVNSLLTGIMLWLECPLGIRTRDRPVTNPARYHSATTLHLFWAWVKVVLFWQIEVDDDVISHNMWCEYVITDMIPQFYGPCLFQIFYVNTDSGQKWHWLKCTGLETPPMIMS